MQLICGQCGKMHAIRPRPGILAARCDRCSHEIQIGHLISPDDMSDEMADEQTMFAGPEGGFYQEAKRSLRERLLVICGNCGGQMKLSKRMAGQIARCPTCGRDVRIPFLDAESEHGDLEFGTGPEEVVATGIGTGQKVHHRRAKPKAEMLLRRRRERAVLAGIGVLAMAMLIAILAVARHGESPTDETGPAASGGATDGTGAWGKPVEAAEPHYVMAVEKPRWRGFAVGRRFPAGPGLLYVVVPVALEAHGARLRISSIESDFLLETPSGAYPALGLVPQDENSLVRALPASLLLPPGLVYRMTLLFEIPAEATRGRVRVNGQDLVASLTLSDPMAAGADLVGEFREQGPRNLKPLLADPVMAALQQTADQVMTIDVDGQAVTVRIPQAGVQGQGRLSATGMARVELQHGSDRLPVLLRRMPDQTIVLYLRDEPMYQLTYASTASRPTDPSSMFYQEEDRPAGADSP